MPSTKAAWAHYYAVTGKASDQARVLALAGIGAVWLFTKTGEGDLSAIKETPQGFVLAGVIFALAIVCDVLQYSVGGEVLRHWIRQREKGGAGSEDTAETPDLVALVPRIFYFAKIVLLLVGYISFAMTVWIAWAE
jgi:hypothetical protein